MAHVLAMTRNFFSEQTQLSTPRGAQKIDNQRRLWYPLRIKAHRRYGEVPKRLRGSPAKGVDRETGARVRISPSPPIRTKYELCNVHLQR